MSSDSVVYNCATCIIDGRQNFAICISKSQTLRNKSAIISYVTFKVKFPPKFNFIQINFKINSFKYLKFFEKNPKNCLIIQ